MNIFLRIAPLVALIILALALGIGLFKKAPENPSDTLALGQHFGAFDLPVIGSDTHFTPQTTQGNVAVVNIFASWCVPCAAEHKLLMALSKKATIYGIAWKDSDKNISEYLQKNGNPFRAVALDTRGEATLALGLSGVPETFVLDKNGAIAYHYKSALTEDEITNNIIPLLERLNAQPR